MNSLSDVVGETLGHFFARMDISLVGICQIAAQQCERKTVAPELIAGAAQLGFLPVDAKRPEQFRSGSVGELF